MAAESVSSSIQEQQLTIPRGGLRLLLALVSSEGTERETLRRKLNLGDVEYRSLLNALQRLYLVDIVSGLSGEAIRETLRLTDYGESILTRTMEKTFELPE